MTVVAAARRIFLSRYQREDIIMAESLVVSGLVAKRGELAGEVERHRRELQRLADELGHVDATIRLFDPAYDLGGIRPRRRGHRTLWFGPGECQRLVLDTLREAREPLSGRALAQELAARKGWETDREVPAQVNKTVSAVLRRLVAKGVVGHSPRADGTRVWDLSGR
jgi:hypothetical protein